VEYEAKVHGPADGFSAYLDVYTASSTASCKQLRPTRAARSGLNVAIATANVAALAPRQRPLQEHRPGAGEGSNDGIVLWGIKAAKSIIPVQVGRGVKPDVTLIAAVLQRRRRAPKGVVSGRSSAKRTMR
jgi:hypothetical protein